MEIDRRIYPLCEVCNKNPAKELKGGILEGHRGVWEVCSNSECKDKIKDNRHCDLKREG
jgi:hypothetical protein